MNVQEKLGHFADVITDYNVGTSDFYDTIVHNENLTFGEWTEVVSNHMTERDMSYRRDIFEWVATPGASDVVDKYVDNYGYTYLEETIQRAYCYDISSQLMNEEDYITEYALLRILEDKGFEEIDDKAYSNMLSATVSTYEIDFETIVKLIEEELQ